MNKTTDDRMLALMRLILALSALLIALWSHSYPAPYGRFTFLVITLYVVYSAGLYLLACRLRDINSAWLFAKTPLQIQPHWIDIASYSLLITCSGGTSFFFLLYFFPIVTASFQWGYRPGLRATLGSAILLSLAGYLTIPSQHDFRFNHFLLEPAYLLILGYIISFIGGSELTLRRQLILLKDMNSLSNPRFGIERTLGALTERLRLFYDADKCVMTIGDWNQIEPHLRSAVRAHPEAAMKALPLTPPMQHQLLDSLNNHTVWQHSLDLSLKTSSSFYLFDREQEKFFRSDGAFGTPDFNSLAATLDVKEFFSAPMCCRGAEVGRLFILNPKNAFSNAEATFLFQAIEHIIPSLDNSLILDRLASDAAEEERHRIARDLHDSIIQPYIGLKMGINALSQELKKDGDVAASVQRLAEITDLGIAELYDYVSSLKGSGRAKESLHSSIERFVAKFTAATTIAVDVEMDAAFSYNERLAAELFQMICEGLSNIRRHTQATRAGLKITTSTKNLELAISNEETQTFETVFVPRSISGRATSLGGTVLVDHLGAETVVRVTIPL